jgi:hypothetical protein
MPKQSKAKKANTGTLKGWQQIAAFLGEPVAVVRRWGQRGCQSTAKPVS